MAKVYELQSSLERLMNAYQGEQTVEMASK